MIENSLTYQFSDSGFWTDEEPAPSAMVLKLHTGRIIKYIPEAQVDPGPVFKPGQIVQVTQDYYNPELQGRFGVVLSADITVRVAFGTGIKYNSEGWWEFIIQPHLDLTVVHEVAP